jgi:Ca-activated chloride channel homolog
MEFGFMYPEYLHLFLIVPLTIFFYFLFYDYHKRKTLPFVNFAVVKRISKKYTKTRHISLLIIRIITFSLIIMSLSGMYIIMESISDSYDMVIAIDTSTSMLADDMKPNRLESVKNQTYKIIDNLETGSNLGILSYSSITRIEEQLTNNKNNLRRSTSNIQISQHSSSDIAQLITTATNILIPSSKPKLILLFTDGQHNVGSSLDTALLYAKEKHVKIFPIAVGTDTGGFVQGINLSFNLDKKNLMYIANLTNGNYYNFNDSKKNLELDLSTNLQNSLVNQSLSNYLLYATLFILLIEFVLVKTIFKITP